MRAVTFAGESYYDASQIAQRQCVVRGVLPK